MLRTRWADACRKARPARLPVAYALPIAPVTTTSMMQVGTGTTDRRAPGLTTESVARGAVTWVTVATIGIRSVLGVTQ
jgi:hypothetical protein